METTGVERWEDEVDCLNQREPRVVVELPGRVCEQIRKDLRDPEEAKDPNRVPVLCHETWAENYQRKGYDEDVNYHV